MSLVLSFTVEVNEAYICRRRVYQYPSTYQTYLPTPVKLVRITNECKPFVVVLDFRIYNLDYLVTINYLKKKLLKKILNDIYYIYLYLAYGRNLT